MGGMWRGVRLTEKMCKEIDFATACAQEDVELVRERSAALYARLVMTGAMKRGAAREIIMTLVGLAVSARERMVAVTVQQVTELCACAPVTVRSALNALERRGLIERVE